MKSTANSSNSIKIPRGWRRLNMREIVKKGDKIYYGGLANKWISARYAVGLPVLNYLLFIRKTTNKRPKVNKSNNLPKNDSIWLTFLWDTNFASWHETRDEAREYVKGVKKLNPMAKISKPIKYCLDY